MWATFKRCHEKERMDEQSSRIQPPQLKLDPEIPNINISDKPHILLNILI